MSLKLTQQQLTDLLSLVGVQVVVADEATEQNLDEIVAQIDNNRKGVLKSAIEAELRPEIETAAQGKIMGSLRSAINSHLNCGQAPLKDLEGKDLIKKVLDLHAEKFGQDAEGLRNELTQAQQKHQQDIEAWEKKYTDDINAEKQRFVDRDINDNLLGVINNTPRVGGDPLEQTKAFRQYLNSIAHIQYNAEAKSMALRTLENREMPLQNKEKTRELTIEELAKEWAGKVGILKTDNRNIKPADVMQQMGGNRQNPGDYRDPVQPGGDVKNEVDRLLQAS